MEKLNALKGFYDEQLLPVLEKLEPRRKQVHRKRLLVKWLFRLIWVGFFAAIIFLDTGLGFQGFWVAVIVLLIAQFVANHMVYPKDFYEQYKKEVVEPIIKFIDPGLRYSHQNAILEEDFNKSRIFNLTPRWYDGDDLIIGQKEKTKFYFSEAVSYKFKKRYFFYVFVAGLIFPLFGWLIGYSLYRAAKKGSHAPMRVLLGIPFLKSLFLKHHFKGLFFFADFNKHFKGYTIAFPQGETFFAPDGTERIRLEDPQFEKQFDVYGSDQIEARYILTTSLMERISNFYNQAARDTDDKRDVYISFVDERMYIAIPFKRDLFEPDLSETFIRFEPVQEYFEDIDLAYGVVEDMHLNTRIWSKE